jgi:uncharacterized protein YoxC
VKDVNDIIKKLKEVAEEGKEAADKTKDFVERVSKTISSFLILRIANRVIKSNKRGERGKNG